MKIYTRTGDLGTTGLLGGTRVSKDDLRIDSYGLVDELNSVLGVARAAGLPAGVDDQLRRVQEDLLQIGSDLADARPGIPPNTHADRVTGIESWIDRMEESLPPLRNFILPGGSPPGATLHLARTVCRRCERRVVTLAGLDPRAGTAVVYLNRLSDALFVAARYVNKLAGAEEIPWKGR